MQMVDMEETAGKELQDDSLQKKKLALGSEKPLSADAIKKAKMKEKYLDHSPSVPLSPPDSTGTTQAPGQSPPLSAPVSHALESSSPSNCWLWNHFLNTRCSLCSFSLGVF